MSKQQIIIRDEDGTTPRKFCRECGGFLPLDQFYSHPAELYGRMGICKECHKTAGRIRRAEKKAYNLAHGLIKPRPKPRGPLKHGHRRMDKTTPEYESWRGMKARCYYPRHINYGRYGGRGIRVCSEWLSSFSAFLRDMGSKPTVKHSIDRINNDDDYRPDNCRWATSNEQARNRSQRAEVDRTMKKQVFILRDEIVRHKVIEHIESLNLKHTWSLTIERYRPKRTLSQNNLYWMWLDDIVGHIHEHTGVDKDDIHEFLKAKFLSARYVKIDGEIHSYRSTRKLTTAEMAAYTDKVYAWATSELGLLLPLPEELGR